MNKTADVVQVIETMNKSREKTAKELFGYEAVKEQIVRACGQGLGHVRIGQNLAANLKDTQAAKLLVENLKSGGYTVEWVTTTQREISNGKETGAFIEYQELRISWARVKIHSGPQAEIA
ncbi:hypothetical protein J7382_19850 [Shimia sp. R11_0]|uniref:hypothetical protein n=1 Tax=Shimia sp. R11_0 TaxID=2821096 RepID=UPI001ADBE0DD|nr:hypothetical protein [Shimia sp. R11_0]MBO9479796.1 hypothetical protein [Shimia sp. R11_0]